MKSIQTKFIVLILVCVIFSSLVIGGAGILNSKIVVDSDSAKIMNSQCSLKAAEINALLSRIEQSVGTLSVYSFNRLESLDKLKNDPAYLQNYTKQLEEVAVNAASNTEGAMAVYIRFNPEFTPPTSGLFWSKTTANGNFTRHAPTDLSAYGPNDTEHVGWYYLPIKNGKPTWMAPYINKNIGVEMISFVVPLYVNNEIVGVVGMDIDFKVITDIVAKILVYENGYAFLTDESANIMYHKFFEKNTYLPGVDENMRLLSDEMRYGTSGSYLFSYKLNGQDKKMAFRDLDNGMKLAITAPLKEINSARNSLMAQIIVASAVIVVLSLLLTIFVTRHLVRPLKELNQAAKKIAAGNFSIALSSQTKDEVGTLTESFQQTVEHLQKYIKYINGLAYRDPLTGVKNKTAYLESETRLEDQMRLGKPEFAIVMLDINGLKHVNDTYGHDFGDMLITSACRIICKTFQHSPVYRIGGDEFVVILEKQDFNHYSELLEKLNIEMDAYNKTARPELKVSIARGIAVYNSETDLVFANVFKRADDAMYQNKAAMKELASKENKPWMRDK